MLQLQSNHRQPTFGFTEQARCPFCSVAQPSVKAPKAKYNFRKTQDENTGIRGLMRGMATLPQGNQELLVVRD